MALHHIEAFLGEMAMLARTATRRDDLHLGVNRLHPSVHLLVEQVLEQALPRISHDISSGCTIFLRLALRTGLVAASSNRSW